MNHPDNSGNKVDHRFLYTRFSSSPANHAGSNSKDGKFFSTIALCDCSLYILWNHGINPTGRFGVANLDNAGNGSHPVHHAAVLNFLPYQVSGYTKDFR